MTPLPVCLPFIVWMCLSIQIFQCSELNLSLRCSMKSMGTDVLVRELCESVFVEPRHGTYKKNFNDCFVIIWDTNSQDSPTILR